MIQHHLATIKELETYYSYDDALDMLECLAVQQSNEYLQYKALEKKVK